MREYGMTGSTARPPKLIEDDADNAAKGFYRDSFKTERAWLRERERKRKRLREENELRALIGDKPWTWEQWEAMEQHKPKPARNRRNWND